MVYIQEKRWVVQKFGGTSLGKLLPTITQTIIPQYLETYNIAVVCSALSGSTKALGTTSLLLLAIDQALVARGSPAPLNATINKIRDEHLKISKLIFENVNLKIDSALKVDLEGDIVADCEQLRSFLLATQTIGELSPTSKDRVVATGERLACRIVVAALKSQGIGAELISLQELVAEAYGADLHRQNSAYDELGPRFFDALAQNIGSKLEACGNRVPVVTGFFGAMPYSLLQSVGRGYSDLCAAMCAVGVAASELQIWKEVDGIFTADPRRVPSARLLPTITLEEASELTYYGSEVIHPLTMEQIRHANIPLRLKNVKNPSGRGTIIYPSQEYGKALAPITPPQSGSASPICSIPQLGVTSFMNANGYYGSACHRRAPTALTSKDSIVLVNIQSNRRTKSHGFLAQIFRYLDERNVVVDLITSSEQNVSLALEAFDNFIDLQKLVKNLERCGTVSVLPNMSIVSVIGHKMRNMVGINGQIFSKLARGGVNVYFVSQGASEINVSFVVHENDAQIAIDILHVDVLGIPHTTEHMPMAQNGLMKGPWLY